MSLNLDEVRTLLQQLADEHAAEGEAAKVDIERRSDVPAIQVSVTWTRDGKSETASWAGPPQNAETEGRLLIAAHGNRQPSYYFRASGPLLGEGGGTLYLCNPNHKHRTPKEAEDCSIHTRESDGETIHLDTIVWLSTLER